MRHARTPSLIVVTGVMALVLPLLVDLSSRTTPDARAEDLRRPNIVVVMADDMRFTELRFAPTVRRLARHGVRFENSFSPFPLCCPARASFLTGRLSHNHDVYWHGAPHGYADFDDSRTLATSLKRAGYRTGFVGKYLNRYGPARSKVSGMKSYRYVPRGWTDWYAAFENPDEPGIHGGTYHYFNTPFTINGRVRNHEGTYQARLTGRYTRTLVEKYHRRRAPFFLYVNYLAPHNGLPYEADDPRGVRDRRGHRVKVNTPARPRWVRGRYDRLIDRAAGVPRGGGPTERDVSDKPGYIRRRPELSRSVRGAAKELTRQRAEAIHAMDRDIARTVRLLKRTGEWRNTVFVFTSDNGYYLGEHRIPQGKVHGHEPSLRVPLVVTGPGLRDGSRRFDPATTVDLAATVIDLARADPPRRPDGTSLLPTLRQGDRGWTRAVPIESSFGNRSRDSVYGARDYRFGVGIRTSRYTYIRLRSGRQELYDLARDPHQLRSVHRDPSYRRVRRALRRAQAAMVDCVGRGCRVRLPDRLDAGPGANRRTTRGWLADHHRRYRW
jgi:arylsulfatase A-like enzyme